MRPALLNIPKKVMTSKITSQFPILDAPWGKGLRENLVILILSTCISATFVMKANRNDTGNAKPNKARKLNYMTNSI